MAYTTPATFVAGNVLTASQLNTYLRDNVAWIATDSPTARAYNNANIAVTTSTQTAVTLNSERHDNAALHSTSVNTSRFTIPSGGGGKYLMLGHIEYENTASGTTRNLDIYINNTTAVAKHNTLGLSASAVARLSICTVYSLSAADYVEMQAFHDRGSNLNINTQANWSPEAAVFWFRT